MKRFLPLLLLFALIWGSTPVLAQTTVMLNPSKDNTLFESTTGASSNAIGSYMYVGRTNRGDLRRGILAFDLTGQIPSNAIIESVKLTLSMERTVGGEAEVSLHRVTADWGEGTSNGGTNTTGGGAGVSSTSGDATWMHRFFDTDSWQSPGGDFAGATSATTPVDGNGSYMWGSTAQMVADVQAWVDNSANNFGWILIGDESQDRSAKTFATREATSPPVLEVTFSTSTATEEESVPAQFVLEQNYPNPFNPTTQINYTLRQAQAVTLVVYNVLGEAVATLVDGFQPSGLQSVSFDAADLASGLYYYRLTAGGTSQTRAMIVQK